MQKPFEGDGRSVEISCDPLFLDRPGQDADIPCDLLVMSEGFRAADDTFSTRDLTFSATLADAA